MVRSRRQAALTTLPRSVSSWISVTLGCRASGPNRLPPSRPAMPMSCAARPSWLVGTDGACMALSLPTEAEGDACPRSEVRAVVPGQERPAVEVDALDQVLAAALEERDPGVDVRHAVERRQMGR